MKVRPGPWTQRKEPSSSGEVAAQTSVVGPAAEAARFEARSSNRSRPSVDLHIQELVLDGFEAAHRYMVGDAVERELTRLFTEESALVAITQDVEIERLNGGAFNLKPGSSAEATGIQLARMVYGGLPK